MNRKAQVFVITGASSGIGAALARAAYAGGARVVLAARRLKRLRELCAELDPSGERCMALGCDVTQDEDVQRLVAATLERFARLDVLIANAGFGVSAPFDQLELEDYRRQLETNLYGVLRCAKAALPALRQSRGVLALMGSVCGYLSMPGVTPYSVSKYALRALAEGLGCELEKEGVRVLHIAPGFVKTEFRQVDNEGVHHAEHQDPVPSWLACPADRAAKVMLRAIRRRRREVVVTGHGRVLVWLVRHVPRFFGFLLRRSGALARQAPGAGPR
ncbi:MAG: short chain dehydrogenase [Planctomycetota bacterium]|nr:MAG: short chain dehydrogenase [Planctomycetota bacterium]